MIEFLSKTMIPQHYTTPNISNFAVSKWHPKSFLGHRTSIFDLFKGWAIPSRSFTLRIMQWNLKFLRESSINWCRSRWRRTTVQLTDQLVGRRFFQHQNDIGWESIKCFGWKLLRYTPRNLEEHAMYGQLATCDDPKGASRAYLLQRMLLPGHPVFMAI